MSSLQIHRANKVEIKEEEFYDNSLSSIIMFQSRSNTLRLNWRLAKEGGSAECTICREEEETLLHFIRDCKALEGIRRENQAVSTKPINQILLFDKVTSSNARVHRKYIEKLWIRRRQIMERMREDN